MWPLYALFSAIAAAFVAIFAKLGLKDIDPLFSNDTAIAHHGCIPGRHRCCLDALGCDLSLVETF